MLRTSIDAIADMEVLLCPACGFEYVNPLKVKVATGNKIYVIDSEGFGQSRVKLLKP